jgi:hypothetical protein
MKSIVIRLIATLVSILAYGWINFLLNPVGTLLAGQVAGKQFDSSDTSYVISMVGMNFFGHLGIPFVILLVVLVALWLKYIKMLWAPIVVLIVVGFMYTPSAHAYYAKTDITEATLILPNESAFWIPDVGDNKNNQASFDSEDYLRANKIPAKRFLIPHTKLSGSGGWASFDYYVPAGRLILVDRTPYSRSWVSATDRGTSNKNEGFPLQSKEGLNITLGISIATVVTEPDSPKFLFNFGVKPPGGDRTTPEVIFTSVYYGRSLTEVMDSVVHEKVHALLGEEFTSRTFDECNTQATAIMKKVHDELETYLKSVGITLVYVGWADTFEFDPAVQAAINRRYIASQDKYVAEQLAPYVATIQALAAADALRSFGAKTDGKLPTTIVGLPTGVGGLLSTLLNPSAPSATPVPAPVK